MNSSVEEYFVFDSSKRRESNGTFDCIGMNTISYSRFKRENQFVAYNSFNSSNSLGYLHRYDRHWTTTNFPPPPPTRFSNKIVLIVDCSSLEVVHMNDSAARILFNREKISDKATTRIDCIVSSKYAAWVIDSTDACKRALGAVIVATSDLIDIVDSKGEILTVSAFVQKLTRPMSERCLSLFAFERCHRFVTNCCINNIGSVIDFDQNMMALFGKNVKNCNIETLLNSVHFKEMIEMNTGEDMYITGKNKNNNAFPLTVQKVENPKLDNVFSFQLQVYTSISGLLILNQNGVIVDCNAAFLRIFLGHEDVDNNVINHSITTIIPYYYEMARCNRTGSCEFSQLDGLSANVSSDINDSISAARLTTSLAKDIANCTPLHSPPCKRRRNPSGDYNTPAKASNLAREVILREAARTSTTPIQGKTSTPTQATTPSPGNGHYHCNCLHRDGSLLEVECLVSQIESDRWALWLCRSCQDPHTIDLYLDSVPMDICLGETDIKSVNSVVDCNTDYFEKYDNFVELQAGRLGPIFVAKRKSKALEDRYITKFLTKTELKSFDTCLNDDGKLVPRETFILSMIDCPFITKIVDTFEDAYFYQIVQQRHGCSTDIVNFIALNPDMDEQLCAYMFQQLICAVAYLHDRDIVHRNIRAENVVLDHMFNVKLIDFSHAHATNIDDLPFVGGLDYCPPEVLHGLRCLGKPSDIWSLGVVLFMMMFGFLPFKEPYAIIRSIRLLPNLTSDHMSDLFSDLFSPLPQTRITCTLLERHSWVKQEVEIELYRWEDVVKRGDIQTHLDYQAYQRSPPNSKSANVVNAYRNCSPVVDRRRRETNNITSILNKTIEEEDFEENFRNDQVRTGEQVIERSLSSFMRSLSDQLKKNDDIYEASGAPSIDLDDTSYSNFDDTIKDEDEGKEDDKKDGCGATPNGGSETTTATH